MLKIRNQGACGPKFSQLEMHGRKVLSVFIRTGMDSEHRREERMSENVVLHPDTARELGKRLIAWADDVAPETDLVIEGEINPS